MRSSAQILPVGLTFPSVHTCVPTALVSLLPASPPWAASLCLPPPLELCLFSSFLRWNQRLWDMGELLSV